MSKKLDHIAIATHSIDETLPFYENALGLKCTHIEEVKDQGVRVAMLPLGDIKLELMEPLDESSPVAKFLTKKGPGLHHIAVGVEDLKLSTDNVEKSGGKCLYSTPYNGAEGTQINFVHPKSTGGVLLELVEK